ncbi:Tim44/TimA family putative adaptor protein [Teichococcus vastitatis]|uniref:Tim44/TimA family putative adaptor protein n=1 Tax=Teichococcus vastitatis TaxID=2307076 RepID=A0ABS9WB64_9PROT|nr:Tim44/TimA family putative adaptor protein [Pseudoroseomonas vastitatis]MCI0756545.1 Tim44/TimA family putative adaptor protein [Pseudoroseomonas vastitatis]
MSGGFPIDLILFGMVAAFLVLRLRSVLGRRQGFERPPQEQPVPAAGVPPVREPDPTTTLHGGSGSRQILPAGGSAPGQALEEIRRTDPTFDPRAFLAGAEGAFGMVITAFAAGDRATLRNLLSDDTYAGFEQAITAREAAGEHQRTELRSIQEMAVEAATLRGSIADITVRIVSDQVNLTTNAQNEVVAGTEAVTELTDIWTFQRDLRSSDPAWKLVATQSA